MINFHNNRFFGFDVACSDDLVSINIMVDPQEFELKSYKRTPFVSVIIKNEKLASEIKLYGITRQRVLDELLHTYFPTYYFRQYNLYTDAEYDKYTSKFENRRFHTIIYYFDDTRNDWETLRSKSILIAAIPIRGMVSPIPKSIHYKIYNGCFISCKPFKFDDYVYSCMSPQDYSDIYNKLVYVLVEVKSVFSIQEFIHNPDSPDGLMNYFWWTNSVTNYPDKQGTRTIYLPYSDNEELFKKPEKNIFYLSDVPKDIMIKKETMSVKI